MEYKLLTLDLDGTLLEPDLTILPQVKQAVSHLLAQGVAVTLSTGRAFPSAKLYADALGLSCPLICYNGAVIKTPGGQVFHQNPLPLQLMAKIIEIGESRGWYLQLYNDDQMVVERICHHTRADPDFSNMPCLEVGRLSQAALSPSPKMMTRCRPFDTALRTAILKEAFGNSLYIAGSTPNLVEIMCNAVSKAHALAWLCVHLGIDLSQTVVCGDGGNDLEIISAAGMGCAMANAVPKVKQAAGYTSPHPNGLGVLDVINNFFGS